MNRAALRDLSTLFTRAESGKISFNDLRSWVATAACADERFNKNTKGETCTWCWVADIVVEEIGVVDGQDKDVYRAIIQGADNKYYEVTFTFADSKVTLGEAVTVAPVTRYEKTTRAAAPVDSPELTETAQAKQNHLRSNTMPPEATTVDENKIRAEAASETRVTVEKEFKTRAEAVQKRNEEIHAIANEFVKSHGTRWNGKPGEVFVVGERIRSLEMAACNAPADHDAAEVRREFKRQVNEALEGSRAAKVQEQAANLPEELAGRCSLRNIYNAAARSKGDRTTCFIPKDGAEREAHDEIHTRAADFPGGVDCLGEGLIFPINAPGHVRGARAERLTRDALASNYATAGAMIAPQYIFPIIELLRNEPALARVGMTYLGGVMGNLTLPRQQAATTAQSLPEGAALAQYDQVLGDIKMAPKRVGSSQKYSRLALLQTTPDFEAFVLQDHLAQIALWIDYLGLNGDGTGDQPTGIINQVGVGSVLFGAAATYAKIMDFETQIRAANVRDTISFISTSTARGKLRLAPETLTGSTVVSGSTNAIWKSDDTVLGRTAVDSQQVPNNQLIAGAFRHLIMAQWGGLAIVLDTLSLADQDKYKLSINTYIDFALRHPQAFVVSADSAAQ